MVRPSLSDSHILLRFPPRNHDENHKKESKMSLDRSLKSANSLVRHRNVLTRAERLQRLQDEEKWNDSKSVFGIPKVANRKMALAKAEKAEAPAEGAAAAGAAGAPAAAG